MITPSYGLTATERLLPRLALDWTTGNVQSGVDVARAGVATFVGSNGLIQSASADTQRIDYSNGAAGLLVEESRVNTCLQSGDQSVSPWSEATVGIATFATTQNYAVAPDGTLTATRVLMDLNGGGGSTGNYCWLTQAISVTSGVTYTVSFYAKTNDGTTKTILVRDDSAAATFNTLKTVTGSYQRITVTGTAASTTNANFKIWLRGGVGTSFDADLSVWGWQWEAGAFATSYIPTGASAVTRNADVATMTGTNFSDWFNATEGTFVVEIDQIRGGGRAITITDGTSPNQILIGQSTSGVYASSWQAQFVSAYNSGKAALAFKQNSFAFSINGTLIGTDVSGNLPTVDRLRFGGISAEQPNGTFKKLFYYPQRILNAETQAFSK